jgi:Rieske 2Fe-2S family protein
LSSADYYDPAVYQRELGCIWQREWLCVGRLDDWPRLGDYRLLRLGDQQLILTLSKDGLKAFYNTCRHRGSELCSAEQGRFSGGRIVCPYHAWSYGLDGQLLGVPGRSIPADFERSRFGLYPVALDVWRGFVFINLAPQPATSLADSLGTEAALLDAWPLHELALAHREVHTVNCNWKVFWENFLECYHCPGTHPALSKLVPLYGEGVVSPADLQDSQALKSGRQSLREGAVTWSGDGQTPLPWFAGLSEAQQQAGMTFTTLLPTMFVVAHVDYVRSVRVLPTGPEQTELTVDWLLAPQVLAAGDVDLERLAAFGRQVVMEDARVCEINQRGLRSAPHKAGVLMPQEYDLLWFHDWLRARRNAS